MGLLSVGMVIRDGRRNSLRVRGFKMRGSSARSSVTNQLPSGEDPMQRRPTISGRRDMIPLSNLFMIWNDKIGRVSYFKIFFLAIPTDKRGIFNVFHEKLLAPPLFSVRLQQGGEALTKKSSFFLFHPYTVMAENPSSYLRQRTATLPFSPLLGDGREPSSFLRQRTATLPFSPLLGDGREPSSFLRQRTATLPFSPLLGDGREPSSFLRQRTATSFFTTPRLLTDFLFYQTLKSSVCLMYNSPEMLVQPQQHKQRLQQGGEALTKKSSFFLFHPYTVMAENPSSYLRQRTATLPFSPLLGDGREPSSFLRQRTATLPFSPLLGDGREPSSFLRQRTATLPFSPLLGDGREPSSFLRQRTATSFFTTPRGSPKIRVI
ncbi:hypothetical protein M5K25_013748 [Dendrobium thyrsiflorum]|uniref:Uncharacterized protein n=1 Tax=Dendrobium thyrsiflorum TaxID=117978 RepID=A0ABD0UTX3_DENTH